MSKWRKKALEYLPEMRQVVETSKSPDELWIDIESVFIELINSDNHNLSRRILQYADWCTSAEAGDVANATNQAVYCGFLEEIAQHKNNWPLFNVSEKQSFRYRVPTVSVGIHVGTLCVP